MITRETIENNIGKYIRLGGHGVLDGLKRKKVKYDFYRIDRVDDTEIWLKKYRAKFAVRLNHYYWNQGFEIIDKKEFKTLSVY